MFNIYGSHFYGNKISDYGIEHGFVDYRTLAKAFGVVMNNDIMSKTWDIGYWDQISGFVDNSEEIEELEEKIEELEEIIEMLEEAKDNAPEYMAALERKEEIEEKIYDLEYEQDTTPEIYQFYIVDDNGAEILEECNEIVYRNEELDLNVWGVTHWGTSWDYVLTSIPCNTGRI